MRPELEAVYVKLHPNAVIKGAMVIIFYFQRERACCLKIGYLITCVNLLYRGLQGNVSLTSLDMIGITIYSHYRSSIESLVIIN